MFLFQKSPLIYWMTLVYISTEKYIDKRLTKPWTAIDKLSIIWKSDRTDKIKCSFSRKKLRFILSVRCDSVVWIHEFDTNKTAGEEARRQLHKNVASNIE